MFVCLQGEVGFPACITGHMTGEGVCIGGESASGLEVVCIHWTMVHMWGSEFLREGGLYLGEGCVEVICICTRGGHPLLP